MEKVSVVPRYCTLDSIGIKSPNPLTEFDIRVVVVDVVVEAVEVVVLVDVVLVVVEVLVVVVVVAARQVAFSQPYSQASISTPGLVEF
ncbi:MAG: hypothetical protein L6243_01800 [Candidatus Altiarchaeales archaeon]|nr:hypothetical protein [Candidatus Altiarchaeota archaeon]MBU4341856.1 hypothetical protein [Candidatus Altiarchaeota archaeon]MCG2782303.1 hypothetical protein [Candidatus Altiarchaeales archaeon]